jgi:hypothetical protein
LQRRRLGEWEESQAEEEERRMVRGKMKRQMRRAEWLSEERKGEI